MKIVAFVVTLALSSSAAMAADGQDARASSSAISGQSAQSSDGVRGMMDRMPRTGMAEQLGASGDVDQDFVRMMTPHHQEAMAMARKQIAEGKDPELKKMAQKMLEGQQEEVAELEDWAKRHGKGSVR
jgi:uncharacterized protein (DUF305 family)